jgi:hypothetical protein
MMYVNSVVGIIGTMATAGTRATGQSSRKSAWSFRAPQPHQVRSCRMA